MDQSSGLQPPDADGRRTLEVRVWLRLLATATAIESEVRSHLARRYDTTLPRFDALAQLARAPDGVTMGELSRLLMVTKGNVTGLVDRLVADGLVERCADPMDRRSSIVRLSPTGAQAFTTWLPAHDKIIHALLGRVDRADLQSLQDLLDGLKGAIAAGRLDAKEQP